MYVPSVPLTGEFDLLGGVIKEGRVVARTQEYRICWDPTASQWRLDFRAHADGG